MRDGLVATLRESFARGELVYLLVCLTTRRRDFLRPHKLRNKYVFAAKTDGRRRSPVRRQRKTSNDVCLGTYTNICKRGSRARIMPAHKTLSETGTEAVDEYLCDLFRMHTDGTRFCFQAHPPSFCYYLCSPREKKRKRQRNTRA